MPEPTIIFQDEYLLIVNKPAGMVVNRADTVRQETLQDWIEHSQQYPISHEQRLRNGIVHRLDKETSGVLVVAKTRVAMELLTGQFAERKVSKTYLALLHGILVPKVGRMSLPISRNRMDRERFAVSVTGKASETAWEVKKTFSVISHDQVNLRYYQGFSFVVLKPKTGRTHQLRVHMSHLNHPLVGDSRYNSRKRFKQDRLWCPRQFLHAHTILIRHPETKAPAQFTAPLAEDLVRALHYLS